MIDLAARMEPLYTPKRLQTTLGALEDIALNQTMLDNVLKLKGSGEQLTRAQSMNVIFAEHVKGLTNITAGITRYIGADSIGRTRIEPTIYGNTEFTCDTSYIEEGNADDIMNNCSVCFIDECNQAGVKRVPLTFDFRDLADCIAIDYADVDLGITPRDLKLISGTEDTIFKVNEPTRIIDAVSTFINIKHPGDAYDVVCELRVGSLSKHLCIDEESFITLQGELIQTGVPYKKLKYSTMLRAELKLIMQQIESTAYKLNAIPIASDRDCIITFMVPIERQDMLISELIVKARLLEKRYRFTPKVWGTRKVGDINEMYLLA